MVLESGPTVGGRDSEGSTSTDLYPLWQKAFVSYNNNLRGSKSKNAASIETLPRIRTLDGVIAQVDQASREWDTHRHKGRLDKLRSAVAEYLGLAQTVGDLVVQSAVATFPPAAAIWTVATYAIKTAQGVSTDYDKLTNLIVETGGFLQVLHIIETKVPHCKQYQECVTEVFTSLLVIFAIYTRFMNETRTFTFFRYAIRGSDPELAAAYTRVRKAIDRLSQANGFRAVANTEDLIRLMGDLDLKLDMQHREIMNVFAQQGQSFQGLFQLGWEQISLMQGVDKALKEMMKNANTMEQGSKSQGAPLALKSATRKGAHLVNFYFGSPTDPAVQYREIENLFVTGTSKWIFQNELFVAWRDAKFPILWISGNAGAGKSCLAYTIAKSLKEDLNGQSRTSVAYYFFKYEHLELRSVKNALYCIITQIAALDNKYCEKVAEDLTNEKTSTKKADLQYIWNKYLASNFGPKSDAKLYLVLDGLDEARSADMATFFDLLNQIQTKSLSIHVILTGRPGIEHVEMLKTEVVEVTNQQTSHDIARIVKERCKMRRFTNHTKSKMTAKLTEKADCLLYVDRMLRELKSLGSGRAVWQALDDLPDDLYHLYAKLLKKSSTRNNPREWQEVKRLYAFVAFSMGPMTLNALQHLLSTFTQDNLIDVEEEISGCSASMLELSRPLRDDEVTADAHDVSGSGARVDDFSSESDDDGSALVRFRDRSLREFFLAFEAKDDEIGSDLRTAPLEANLDLLYASVKLMCAFHSQGDEQPANGLSFAVNDWFWYMDALSMDVDLASDCQVIRVVNILREISIHEVEVAKAIVEHCEPYYYIDFASTGLPAIAAWTKRAAALADVSSLADAREWITKMTTDPEEILRHLAHGHVVSWFESVTKRLAVDSFNAARDALLETKSSPIATETTDLEAIEVLAHHFDDLQPVGAGSQRAVGLALLGHDCYSQALAYCHESLTNCIDAQDKFLTKVTLADIYASMAEEAGDTDSGEAKTHWNRAHDYVSEALSFSLDETSSIHPSTVKKQRWQALIIRAEYEKRAGKYIEAVNTYEVARDTWPEKSGPLLKDVATILSDREEYSELMKKVDSWGLQNRLYWLALTDPNQFESLLNSANTIFQKAAKLAAASDSTSDRTPVSARGSIVSHSLALMIRIYEEMIEYLERKNQSACLRFRLASAYRDVLGDDLSSKDILDTLLNGDSCFDPSTGIESEETLVGTRTDLALIIFEEFRASTNPQQKVALLNEFEDIPNRRLGRALGRLEIFNSVTAIILGRMIRKVRSAEEYQTHMEKVFQTCVAALSDSVGWNDQSSLYILAKLLTCMPGLETDAHKAISAQISHVDKDLAQFESEVEEPEQEELSPVSPQAASVKSGNSFDQEELVSADGGVVTSEKGQTSSCANLKADNLKDSTTDTPNHSSNVLEDRADEQDEDIMPWGILGCGGCWKIARSWPEMGSMYVCLICPNCDLCQECYDKRQAMNGGDTSVSWRSFCGKDHEYLQAPIPGWKGVKGGVMRIGEEREEFKVWLQGLKDTRWKAAWDEFWKGG